VRANSVSDLASLSASSAKILYHEDRGKARLSANNEALLTSLAGRTLHGRAKFASKSRTRTTCEATFSGEATLASPMVKRKAFKARPKTSQPKLTSSLLGFLLTQT